LIVADGFLDMLINCVLQS